MRHQLRLTRLTLYISYNFNSPTCKFCGTDLKLPVSIYIQGVWSYLIQYRYLQLLCTVLETNHLYKSCRAFTNRQGLYEVKQMKLSGTC